MPIVQNVVRTGAHIAGAVRDLGRLQKVARILAAHGLDFVLDQVHIPGLKIVRKPTPVEDQLPLPVRVRNAVEELGPTFVKLGQVFSTRPDLIPMSWCEQLQTLQDDVRTLPVDAIRTQITDELGAPPEDLFEHFDPEPLAAASMAQVHCATLKTGEDVVLKILRPGVEKVIETDLDILRFLARRVENQFPDLALLGITAMIADFEKSIREETDFTIEARNTQRFKRNLADLPNVYVPAIYTTFSTQRILCQEQLKGIKLRDARDAGCDMLLLGKTYFRTAARMLFEDGFFHGDLHPGNVIVLPDNILGVIDFGMAGTLTEDTRDNVIAVLFAASRADFRTVAQVMFKVGVKTQRVDYSIFESEVMDLMQTHVSGRSMSEVQVGAFLNDLLQGCLRHRMRVPSGYTMLFKAIMTSEGLAKSLIPEMDPLEEFRPVLQKAIQARFSRERLMRDATLYFLGADELLRRSPIIASQIINDYERGQLRIPLLHHTHPDHEQRTTHRVNRVIITLILCTLILSSVLSLNMPQWSPGGIPVLSMTLFFTTSVLSLWLFSSILKTGGIFEQKDPNAP